MKNIYSPENRLMAARLRQARLNAGMTQVEAAQRVRRTQSYVSKLERGLVRIDLSQVSLFAKLYKKKLGYFIKNLSLIAYLFSDIF